MKQPEAELEARIDALPARAKTTDEAESEENSKNAPIEGVVALGRES